MTKKDKRTLQEILGAEGNILIFISFGRVLAGSFSLHDLVWHSLGNKGQALCRATHLLYSFKDEGLQGARPQQWLLTIPERGGAGNGLQGVWPYSSRLSDLVSTGN